MGLVTIKRSGSFPVDCPVTINVERVISSYTKTYAEKVMSNKQQSIEIELGFGEYEVSATCRFTSLSSPEVRLPRGTKKKLRINVR